MAVGDEFSLTEGLYQELIGRYVATIEVLTKRVIAKDQYIAKIETKNAELEAELVKFTESPEIFITPGEIVYIDEVSKKISKK